jgi:hypothetical protein
VFWAQRAGQSPAKSISYCNITVTPALGRTIPTASMLIQEEIDLFLKTYGKGLSDEHERDALYDLFQLCKKHIHACSQAVRLVPFHGILMSVILEQQKRLQFLIEDITQLANDSEIPT